MNNKTRTILVVVGLLLALPPYVAGMAVLLGGVVLTEPQVKVAGLLAVVGTAYLVAVVMITYVEYWSKK